MTQYKSSVPQRHQRRLSTVHLDGLSILSHELSALGGTEQQQRNKNVLKHVLLTPAVLLSSGARLITGAAGYMTRIVNVNIILQASRSLKLSDIVIQHQVSSSIEKSLLVNVFRRQSS